VIRNGLPDPDSDTDRHQNATSWFLAHTPALHKISSKSVGNFFDNPVNPDFGFRTPGSGRLSGSLPKFNQLVPVPCPIPPRNFVKIRSQLFQLFVGSYRVKIWIGENWGRSGRILTPNELDLTFWVPDYGAKFHQNRARTATVGGRTDKQTDKQTNTPKCKHNALRRR